MGLITEMKKTSRYFLSVASMVLLAIGASSCGDDPAPVNEEEVITTVTVVLTPNDGGTPVTLKFYDADGDGSIAPVKTVSGNLAVFKTYSGVITLQNESQSTPVDITTEVRNEAVHHLFCFTILSGSNLSVAASDTDSKGLPIGLSSTWTTTTTGPAAVKITLRHQFETKTGECPGNGETDVDVDFNVLIQ
jgi:hypothetical protein